MNEILIGLGAVVVLALLCLVCIVIYGVYKGGVTGPWSSFDEVDDDDYGSNPNDNQGRGWK